MGCLLSAARNDGEGSQDQAEMIAMVVFAPPIRLPCELMDLSRLLNGVLPDHILEGLSSSHAHIVALASAVGEEVPFKPKLRRKASTQQDFSPSAYSPSSCLGEDWGLTWIWPRAEVPLYWLSGTCPFRITDFFTKLLLRLCPQCWEWNDGGTAVTDLQQALEDYLPLLLGLAKEGGETTYRVSFAWKNQEDTELETVMPDCYYEVLSVLHVMAILGLMQANLLLLPNIYDETRSTEERRKEAIDIFLKVSGILECAIKVVMPKLSQQSLGQLPADLKADVLCALSMQALGQSVEIQLGLAIDNMKATLAVKRRIACEQVKYWVKANEDLLNIDAGGVWGVKQRLFVTWKLAEAKAAAFYFHGLILDEGTEKGTHAKALVCLQTADRLLKESQKLCLNFCLANPATRATPIWGAMKYLTEKIPRDYSSKARLYRDMNRREKVPETVPELPDFPLSLQPEEYNLPGV